MAPKSPGARPVVVVLLLLSSVAGEVSVLSPSSVCGWDVTHVAQHRLAAALLSSWLLRSVVPKEPQFISTFPPPPASGREDEGALGFILPQKTSCCFV